MSFEVTLLAPRQLFIFPSASGQIGALIQYMAQIWPWYSLRGLHVRITWFSLYGIHITWFSLYGNVADI